LEGINPIPLEEIVIYTFSIHILKDLILCGGFQLLELLKFTTNISK